MEQKNKIVETMIINARNHLLDTSFNNRMINSKITLNKGLSFSVEDLNGFYNLVINNNSFSFLPLENKNVGSSLHLSTAKQSDNNKTLDKVGTTSTFITLDTTKKPSQFNLKFSMEDGDSKFIYENDKESKFFKLFDMIYADIKKNFTKYGIIQDNIYNKDVRFGGFKKHVDSDYESAGLAIYLAIVSTLKELGIPKDYIFFGGVNDKFVLNAISNPVEKLEAAYEKGYKKAFLPKKNKKDTKALNPEIANNLEIIYLNTIEEAIVAVFGMMNTIEVNNLDQEFVISNQKQNQKVFYVNYNREDLNTRIEKIYTNSKRHIEEQGVNILFLSLGFVQWKNPQGEDEIINSPLLFIPVNIEASNYKNIYKLSYSNTEVLLNKSLVKKLELETNLNFDGFALDIVDENEFNIIEKIEQFYELVQGSGYDFGIDYHSVHLSFYSYNKFLMYNDLDPQNWEASFAENKKNILTDIFVNNIYHEISNIDDEQNIDSSNEINNIKNVLDADSSQLLAISKVNRGNSIIIQGPPGTGKSQTIVNIIAESIRHNKKVLFMSEKLAAMDVVYNRLKAIKLNHVALQLHSDKVNKTQVIKELQDIYYMNKLNVKNTDTKIKSKLRQLRNEINVYYELLNTKAVHSNITLIDAYREIISLENYFDQFQVKHYELNIDNAYLMELEDFEYDSLHNDLVALENFYLKYGILQTNPLNGVLHTNTLTHHDLIRYQNQLSEIIELLKQFIKDASYTKLSNTKGGTFTINDFNILIDAIDKHSNVIQDIPFINHKLMLDNQEFLDTLFMHLDHIKEKNHYIKGEILEKTTYLDQLEKLLESLEKEIKYLNANSTYMKRSKKAYKIRKDALVDRYIDAEQMKDDDLEEALKWLYSAAYVKYQTLKQEPLLEKIFGVSYKKNKYDLSSVKNIFVQTGEIFLVLKELFKDRGENDSVYIDYFKKFITKEFNVGDLQNKINQIQSSLMFDNNILFNEEDYKLVPTNTLLETYNAINNNLASLNDIVKLKEVKKDLEEIADEYLSNLIKSEEHSTHISKVFGYIRNHSLVREILDNNIILDNFNAMIFDRKIREFVRLDNKNIQINNLQSTLDAHFYNVYNIRKEETLSVEHKDERISYLLQTFNRKHNVPTIKNLLETAFEPITQLKPVFMMSPISISQYLEPVIGMFDVVVFDEASQIKPQDAFGALLRGKQVVVVGDEKQLPPTNFFESFYGTTIAFKEDEISNYESILTLLRGSGVPTTTLNWHYRSKHHNLIKTSNEIFYDKSLSIFPSKYKNNPNYGLKYVFVDGIFDRGRSRTNLKEAQVVAKEVIEHAKKHPDASLGVATVNITQRDLILSEIKKLRKDDHDLDAFFNEEKPEPFFVKNLENVQGDEREVIFVSVGYSKDQNGNIIQNFGAINHVGGERRLNVLMTRARSKCVLFTGLKPTDLELDYNTTEGVKVLRKFLEFAERNTISEEETINSDTKIFAIEIADELHKHGYEVNYNVGNSKYYVDLAIINPDDPTEYILGIEFDNSTYKQSRTASERERIRNSVMMAKGWKIYKVYITSWFNNRAQEIEDILHYLRTIEKENVAPIKEEIELYEEPVNVVTRFGFDPYQKYSKTIENIHFFVKENDEFTKYLEDLVYEEMPVNLKTIVNRVVENSHIEIKGSKLKAKIKKALNHLENHQKIYLKEDFYYFYKKEDFIRFRDRRNLANNTILDISYDEFIFAITEIAKNSFGINTEDISSIISNYLGYEGVNVEIKAIVDVLAIRLINQNVLYKDVNGNLQSKNK